MATYNESAEPAGSLRAPAHNSDLGQRGREEARRLLDAWNETRQQYSYQLCVPQLVATCAAVIPGAGALVAGDHMLTYGELNERANRLAHYLRAHGVGPEVLVGVCLDRSLALVVALLGILKAGGAYVPLDPAYPPARLAAMLADAAPPVLLTQQRHLERLPSAPAQGPQVYCVDRDAALLARHSAADPPPLATPDHLAYVIYTSGSSGQPKGVEIPHRALVNLLTSMQREPGLNADDTLLAITTVSFDIAALEIFLPLLAGARLALASREEATSGPALAAALARSGATIMQATPATWRLLIEAGWLGNPRLQMLCGGEALSRELADQLLERGACLWNMYGPTETTIWSACRQITRGRGPILIGRPIANTELYILDQHGQILPIGVPGELHIGGAGLARGYRNRPTMTAERFIRWPLGAAPGAFLYKTGDLARYHANGNVEWLARLDHQVKIRGFRIELEEIESALTRHPAVQESVVIAHQGHTDDRRLVAYIVARISIPRPDDLRRFLKEILPAYMIPAAFVFLPTLPRMPNGKVDRGALSPLDLERQDGEAGAMAPTLTLHHQLVSIWEELLEVRPIGIRDNFFDIGGHSLLAARLVDRIEQVCGVKVPLATLFASATIEDLSALLLRQDGGVGAALCPLVEIQPDGAKPPFFFLHGDLEGGGFYCAQLARALGADQPFYALQPHGVDGGPVPQTIEAMAAEYCTRLQAVRPHGPYILGGFCAAGFVAYEMAQQLRGQGEVVDLVVLINVLKPHRRATLGRRMIGACAGRLGVTPEQQIRAFLLLRRCDVYVAAFARLDRATQLTLLPTLAWSGLRVIAQMLPGPRRPQRQRRDSGVLAIDARREDLFGRYGWAVTGYTARPFPGRVLLVWPQEEVTLDPEDPTMGWRAVAPNSEVAVTPGMHLTSITRYVHDLGDRLRACLSTMTTPM